LGRVQATPKISVLVDLRRQ